MTRSLSKFRILGKLCTLALGLALAAGLAGDALAQSNAGAKSLQIYPGSRAEGMGRIFSSVADDAFGVWWNPAGLGFAKGPNVGLMHAQLVPGLASDVYYEYLSGGTYLKGWGGIAGTLTYLSYGTSQATNPDSPNPIGEFSSFEVAPSVAMGVTVIPTLALGVNLKLVHVNLAPAEFAGPSGGGSGTTFAVDLGALYKYQIENDNIMGLGAGRWDIGVGLNVVNLGPDLSMVEGRPTDPLPRNAKLSASVGMGVPKSLSFLGGFAVEKSLIFEDSQTTETLSFLQEHEILLSGGGEIGFMDVAFARAGYVKDEPGTISGMTYGLGVRFLQFGFDFASIPQAEDLQRVSKFSLVYQASYN